MMKYYLHDTSSFDDEKITLLFMNFGYEGLGLFYTALEKIAKQEKPIDTKVLKSQLRIGKRLNKCWLFIEELGLIQSKNGQSFNEELLNYSEKYQIKKEKNREKVSQWREKQTDTKNVTSYEPVSNPPKVKKSKVKESKEEFESFWDKFHSITGKPKEKKEPTLKHWNRLTKSEKELAVSKIADFSDTNDNKQFLPIARTYLADKLFNDEHTKRHPASTQNSGHSKEYSDPSGGDHETDKLGAKVYQ